MCSDPWAHLYPGKCSRTAHKEERHHCIHNDFHVFFFWYNCVYLYMIWLEVWQIKCITHHLITVIQLQHYIRRVAGNGLPVSIDFDVLKDESLIPRGIQCGPYDFCGLAQVQKWHMGVGIWTTQGFYSWHISDKAVCHFLWLIVFACS